MRLASVGCFLCAACFAALPTLVCCAPSFSREEPIEFVRAMNRGVAHLENRAPELASQAFEEASGYAPNSAPALRNLARVHLLSGNVVRLAETLEKVRALEDRSVATLYLTGLMYARQQQFDDAIRYFEAAVRLDPHTAALRFQLASAYRGAGRHEEAIEQFSETLRLDSQHTPAHKQLADYARRNGDRAELERRLRDLQRLKNLIGDQRASTESLEACEYTLAESPRLAAPSADRGTREKESAVRYRDATGEMFRAEPERTAPIAAASLLDVDEEGRYTLFVVGSDGWASLLSAGEDGTLQRSALQLEISTAVLSSEHIVALAGSFQSVTPFETPSYPPAPVSSDLLLLGEGGIQVFQRTGPQSFDSITSYTGLSGVRGRSARWADYDHDGDVDLLVAGAAGLEIWQNGSDGQFKSVAPDVGIDETQPVWDVAAADLDNDAAIDLVAAGGARSTRVFENQRTGRFAPQPEPPGPWPASERVLIDDLDNDGHADAVLIAGGRALILPGRGGARQRIELGDMKPRAAVLVDFDNDGKLDLAVAGATRGAPAGGRLALWRNAGVDGWFDVSESTGIGSIATPVPRQLLAADLDSDGDSDLLLTTASGLRFLRNDGGNANAQLKIRLLGTSTNPSGIGTRVEVRAGHFRAVRLISSPHVEIGLGGNRQLDSIQAVWTNGVVDNEIQVSVSQQPLEIVEKTVDTGSCPFLYAFDGQRFRFVTDLLGNAPLGLSIRRGEVLPADPDELVRVGDSAALAARDGYYLFQLTDEFREVLYLDQVRLVAVDHAPGVEVHPTDRLMPAPFPPSELWPLRARRTPRSAVGDDGVDRTRAVRAIDGEFASPGRALAPNFVGHTHPLTLILDFGPLDDLREPVLALTGWLQYGDASVNIAVSQNASMKVVPTTLEMETAGGMWLPVDVVVGMPAGKTKTIAIDLTNKLVPGVRRLRLRTSFELRWDRIALFERLPASAAEIHTVAAEAAELSWRGYSEIRARATAHPKTPNWDTVFDRPPWRTTPEGWVTRYGGVLELVVERDGELAILNGGDALELRFAASAFPPLPEGRIRTFFFYSVGWDKDGDYNVVDGDTVEPLPGVAEAGDDWQVRYNTRWVSRDAPAAGP